MKKISLALLLLATVYSATAQIVNIPDPVFKQALLDHGWNTGVEIDTNFDGEIQVSEAEALTSLLDVNGQFIDIHDLTGIEAFVNITALNVILNQLTTLDLSNNTALQVLGCSDNNLTYLNVGQCTALEVLACNNNQLPELDFFNLSQLKTLRCYNNQLTSLNVTNNPLLEILRCFDNQITELNLTQNPNLEDFACTSNQLTQLDVRNGNNMNIVTFNSFNNPDLVCIFVDDETYSEANWIRDPASTFVETEAQCDALGLNDLQGEEIDVYPNPAKDKLHIDGISKFAYQNLELILTDVLGQRIIQIYISQQDHVLNTSNLHQGIYFLTLQSQTKKLLTKKIIKL